jgi:hypothetical protein
MSVYSKNYYSSIQQYSSIASTAFDEGPSIMLNAIGINSSSINTSEIDPFRHGVEITQNKHAYAGIFKISAGTPGHIVKPVCIGVNENVDIVSSNYFLEVDPYDPVTYLKLSSSLARSRVISSEEDFLDKRAAYNGVIEPLSIRSVEGFLSTEAPFQMHSVRGELSQGNFDKSTDANDQVLTVDYIPKKLVAINGSRGYVANNIAYENKSTFYDRNNEIPRSPGSGSISGKIPKTLPINGSVKYFLTDLSGSNIFPNVNFPFDDSQVYLKSLGITVTTHGSDMVQVFNTMTGSTGNYVPPGKKSATSGFIYDSLGYAGVDSIAFGGLTY